MKQKMVIFDNKGKAIIASGIAWLFPETPELRQMELPDGYDVKGKTEEEIKAELSNYKREKK